MALSKPTSYKALRPITIGGTAYAAGDTIPLAKIKTVKHLSALLSSYRIQPVPDPHHRRGRWRHQPVVITAAALS